MNILFLHGWTSVPGGVKPTFLKNHGHTVINPKLPDDDLPRSVQIAQADFDPMSSWGQAGAEPSHPRLFVLRSIRLMLAAPFFPCQPGTGSTGFGHSTARMRLINEQAFEDVSRCWSSMSSASVRWFASLLDSAALNEHQKL
jgi:hypothetical protein